MRNLYSILILGMLTLACNKPKTLPEIKPMLQNLPAVTTVIQDLPSISKPIITKLNATIEELDAKSLTESVEFTATAFKGVTLTVPKKEITDSFTKVKYTQIGVLAIYDKIMRVGKDYPVTIKVFRGTLTEESNTNSITMFTSMSAKYVGILLESDSFIVKSETNIVQTLLPENTANVWNFVVTPTKLGEQKLKIKLGTSDIETLSFREPDSKSVTVIASLSFIRAKGILLREHYIKNQILYTTFGGIIVFLSGFVLVRKKRKS